MGRKRISLSVILVAALTLSVSDRAAEAFDRHRNRACPQNGPSEAQQAAVFIVPYTAYGAPPVGCLPPLGGFRCAYENTGYQTRAYKGCITKLP